MRKKIMSRDELIADYEELRTQLANVNTAISTLMGKPQKYTYSNIESTHMAENQSIGDLRLLRKDYMSDINDVCAKLGPTFVKIKNR